MNKSDLTQAFSYLEKRQGNKFEEIRSLINCISSYVKLLNTETHCQSDEAIEILSTKKGQDDIIHSIKNPSDQKIKLIEI